MHVRAEFGFMEEQKIAYVNIIHIFANYIHNTISNRAGGEVTEGSERWKKGEEWQNNHIF